VIHSNVAMALRNSEKRFEILTALKMSMLVFWVVKLCGLVGVIDTDVSEKTHCVQPSAL
jgi:hypothetical protein